MVVGETPVELTGARANVRTKETNLGNLIAEALLNKLAPDNAPIAITNGGGIRARIDGLSWRASLLTSTKQGATLQRGQKELTPLRQG
ncbi:hypothetical protein HC891_03730 [Candidatus Gracilibacteria bacterium]|nr:hypothetical protein [Candidatus Gracilibacteria bacterium]